METTTMLRGGIVGLCTLVLLGGYAASQQARNVQEWGFLGDDHARLRAGGEGEALLVCRKPDADQAASASSSSLGTRPERECANAV
jgi:hypothetical protein